MTFHPEVGRNSLLRVKYVMANRTQNGTDIMQLCISNYVIHDTHYWTLSVCPILSVILHSSSKKTYQAPTQQVSKQDFKATCIYYLKVKIGWHCRVASNGGTFALNFCLFLLCLTVCSKLALLHREVLHKEDKNPDRSFSVLLAEHWARHQSQRQPGYHWHWRTAFPGCLHFSSM